MAKVCFRILLEKLFCLLEASTYQSKNASHYLPKVCILLNKSFFFFLMANNSQITWVCLLFFFLPNKSLLNLLW